MGRARPRSVQNSNECSRFAYDKLERVIHERARLGIMTSLISRRDGLLFSDLKLLCDLTDGNLNRHLEVLRDEGLVDVRKEQTDGRAQTVCRVTAAGRTRFEKYLDELERVVADAAAAAKAVRESGVLPTRRYATS